MTGSVMVLVPLGLLAIVCLFSFVGCVLDRSGDDVGNPTVTPVANYADIVKNTPNIVAFWPLNETSGTTAVNAEPTANGTYTPAAPVLSCDTVNKSAPASGQFTLGQPGIVAGDCINNDPTKVNPCALFEGGYVKVGWQAALNPPPPFTLEAWVRPDWTSQDVMACAAFRIVVSSNTATTGFALLATNDNYWSAGVGDGTAFVSARPQPGSNQTIMMGTTDYLAMTFDGSTLILYVNGQELARTENITGFQQAPNTIPLYIGTGRPDLAVPPGPQNPFNGRIQDVAFYNALLDADAISTRFLNGNACAVS